MKTARNRRPWGRQAIGVLAAATLAVAAPAWGARPAAKPAEPPLQGQVTKVTDGDSLWFTPTGQPHIVVRLVDIDAPETCQNWGAEARQALADMVQGKAAVLQPKGRDLHGRLLGSLSVDEQDVGRRMVEDGHAWSIRTRWDQGPLVKQERMAKALRRGLHATGDAEMPRNFRVTHGPCTGAAAPVPSPPRPAPAPLAAPRGAGGVPVANRPGSSAFQCDGRQHCSQMRSCDEAKYFLAHCPGVKMDGDSDGIPCEEQWCH